MVQVLVDRSLTTFGPRSVTAERRGLQQQGPHLMSQIGSLLRTSAGYQGKATDVLIQKVRLHWGYGADSFM